MIRKILSAAALLSLFAATPASAAAEKYSYDPVHTQLIFSVSHMGKSHSYGKFTKFTGQFMLDEEKPEASTAEISIDTNSINMASTLWEDHLKAKDFFNVEKFPTMTFKSTKVERTGDKTAKMTGDFTLLGVTKPVTLDVTFNGTGQHPMNKNHVAGFSMTGTLKRSDFGMNYGLPMVGDDINLIIEVEGIRQDFEHAN